MITTKSSESKQLLNTSGGQTFVRELLAVQPSLKDERGKKSPNFKSSLYCRVSLEPAPTTPRRNCHLRNPNAHTSFHFNTKNLLTRNQNNQNDKPRLVRCRFV